MMGQELAPQQLLRFESVTMSKSVFKQLRSWRALEEAERKRVVLVGWVHLDGEGEFFVARENTSSEVGARFVVLGRAEVASLMVSRIPREQLERDCLMHKTTPAAIGRRLLGEAYQKLPQIILR